MWLFFYWARTRGSFRSVSFIMGLGLIKGLCHRVHRICGSNFLGLRPGVLCFAGPRKVFNRGLADFANLQRNTGVWARGCPTTAQKPFRSVYAPPLERPRLVMRLQPSRMRVRRPHTPGCVRAPGPPWRDSLNPKRIGPYHASVQVRRTAKKHSDFPTVPFATP